MIFAQLNADTESWLAGLVASVFFSGYGGSDNFTNLTNLPSVLNGNAGNDRLTRRNRRRSARRARRGRLPRRRGRNRCSLRREAATMNSKGATATTHPHGDTGN